MNLSSVRTTALTLALKPRRPNCNLPPGFPNVLALTHALVEGARVRVN